MNESQTAGKKDMTKKRAVLNKNLESQKPPFDFYYCLVYEMKSQKYMKDVILSFDL